MSIETICKNCAAEYDLRHGDCPACTIEINVRSAHPPYDTWPATGHLPFEMHGERFAVTRIPCALNDAQQWRVSHVETGVALPRTQGSTKEEALANAKAVLAQGGQEKLKASLTQVRALFANKR
jgi:hypothetical protein